MSEQSIQELEKFWNSSPLFIEESELETEIYKYFAKPTPAHVNDCFACKLDSSVIPTNLIAKKVQDPGYGPGFWKERIAKIFPRNIFAALFNPL